MTVYSETDYPFLAPTKAAWKDLRAEYLAIAHRARSRGGNMDWDMVHLWCDGRWFVDPACVPTVRAFVEAVPGLSARRVLTWK
jgi:hypothetical protein